MDDVAAAQPSFVTFEVAPNVRTARMLLGRFMWQPHTYKTHTCQLAGVILHFIHISFGSFVMYQHFESHHMEYSTKHAQFSIGSALKLQQPCLTRLNALLPTLSKWTQS